MLDYFKQVLGLEKIYFMKAKQEAIKPVVFCDISSEQEKYLFEKILSAINLKAVQIDLRSMSDYKEEEIDLKQVVFSENYLLFENVNRNSNKVFIPTLSQMLKEESLKKQAWVRLKNFKI